MGPSDPSSPWSADLPTESVPTTRATRRPAPPTGPVDLPEIRVATEADGTPISRQRPAPPRRPAPDPFADPFADLAPDTFAEPTAPARPDDAFAPSWDASQPVPVVEGPPTAEVARVVGPRPRVRRVTRVVRHVDTWSVFKVAGLFSVTLYLVLLTSGVLLWRVADSTGTLANVERWFTQFGWETFELQGGEIYHNAWTAGLFGVVALTGLAVLTATLFNLISDIVGGVRVAVLEEEVVAAAPDGRRRSRQA